MASLPVEIKINVGGDVDAALDALSLGKGDPREVYFAEDLTPGLASSHPLLAAGVVVRLRREADGRGDSTVKLRPCRRSQLMGEWAEPAGVEDQWDYRIEGDWSGSRRVLAASLVQELTSAEVASRLTNTALALHPRQLSFLEACASIRVNPTALRVLGPISATRWTKIEVGPVKKVTAERWRLGSLDFLELSLRADADEAPAELAGLTSAAIAAGLTLDASSASKTEQVLDALIEDQP